MTSYNRCVYLSEGIRGWQCTKGRFMGTGGCPIGCPLFQGYQSDTSSAVRSTWKSLLGDEYKEEGK